MASTVVGGTLLPAIASDEENQVLFEDRLRWWPASELEKASPTCGVRLAVQPEVRGGASALGLNKAMRKNFLGVKGMTLMG